MGKVTLYNNTLAKLDKDIVHDGKNSLDTKLFSWSSFRCMQILDSMGRVILPDVACAILDPKLAKKLRCLLCYLGHLG